jgi:hypothetical protein
MRLRVDSTIARRIRIQAHLRAAGAAPRQRSAARFFSNTNSATDTGPLRLTVATTARGAWRLRSCSSHPRGFRGFAALGLVCLSALSPTQAAAEVVIDGGRDEMQVRVENDTVGHVLEALGQKGNLHYGSATPLNKVVDGSFSGSLGQVLFRILGGYDFVIRHDPDGVEIFVFGESSAAPIPPAPMGPTAQGPSPRPRPAGSRTAAVDLVAPRNVALQAPSQ